MSATVARRFYTCLICHRGERTPVTPSTIAELAAPIVVCRLSSDRTLIGVWCVSAFYRLLGQNGLGGGVNVAETGENLVRLAHAGSQIRADTIGGVSCGLARRLRGTAPSSACSDGFGRG